MHGFHIHTLGLINDNCIAAESHFNPENKTHGSPADKNRHVGDLGNIKSNVCFFILIFYVIKIFLKKNLKEDFIKNVKFELSIF